MINRKIILSGMSIMTALTMMGTSAFAAFTTTATATGNTFSTADPNLLIDTNGDDLFDTSEPGFSVTGLVPGGSSSAQPFTLKNTGSGAPLPVSLKFGLLSGNTLNGADMSFTVVCTGSQPVTQTYSEWLNNSYEVGTVPNEGTLDCSMTGTLHTDVGNSAAGAEAKFDAVFTGTLGTPAS